MVLYPRVFSLSKSNVKNNRTIFFHQGSSQSKILLGESYTADSPDFSASARP